MTSAASAACAAFPKASLAQGQAKMKSHNTKGAQGPKVSAKAKARSDPVAISMIWRRKTLKDYNKVLSGLPSAKLLAEKSVEQAGLSWLIKLKLSKPTLYYVLFGVIQHFLAKHLRRKGVSQQALNTGTD